MNNFKKASFLILIVSIMFMVGCVSAVDIEDASISSENSASDLALDECQLENISESDASSEGLVEQAANSEELSSSNDEPATTSEAFDSDKLSDADFYMNVWNDPAVNQILWRVTIYNLYPDHTNPRWVNITFNDIHFIDKVSTLKANGIYLPVDDDYEEIFDHYFKFVNSTTIGVNFYNIDKYDTILLVTNRTSEGNASMIMEFDGISRTFYSSRLNEIEGDLVVNKTTIPFPTIYPETDFDPNGRLNFDDFQLVLDKGRVIYLEPYQVYRDGLDQRWSCNYSYFLKYYNDLILPYENYGTYNSYPGIGSEYIGDILKPKAGDDYVDIDWYVRIMNVPYDFNGNFSEYETDFKYMDAMIYKKGVNYYYYTPALYIIIIISNII